PMDIDDTSKEILENIIELLEENDDIQNVYHSANL
ncbi:MAG: transcriptional/translational regulatory protein YebC/TACO1, partial [Crocinitomicaceae bacterium]